MLTRFGLICGVATVILCWSAGTADAQIVVITDTNYTAPMGIAPATASPIGTLSIPGAGTYRVVYDYGTINNGVYTVSNTAAGGTSGTFIRPR